MKLQTLTTDYWMSKATNAFVPVLFQIALSLGAYMYFRPHKMNGFVHLRNDIRLDRLIQGAKNV